MAKKTVKENIQEHKKGIMLAAGLAVGTVVGGTVMYMLTRDARGLADTLKRFGKSIDDIELGKRIKQYVSNSNAIWYGNSTSDRTFTVGEIGDIANIMIRDAEEYELLDNKIVGTLVFVKED